MNFPATSFRLAAIIFVTSVVTLCFGQDASTSSPPQQWTSTSQQQSASGTMNPIRTRESHREENGRVVDKRTLERLGPDGRYVPYLQVEKETIQVDANTVRTVERTFGTGANGDQTLVQVQEAESRALPGGEQKLTRTTSNPDANGRLQVVQREVQNSKQTSPGVRQTATTIFTASSNGGLAPSMKIEENESREGSKTTYKKSTLLPDLSGRWTVGEVREGTITGEQGREQTKEERVLRPNAEGRLAVMERTVSREAAGAAGEKQSSTETYSTNVPGTAPDGKLHLVQRETTVQRTDAAGGQSTVQQVEGLNPGDPVLGLRVQSKTVDIARPGVEGTAQQRTVYTIDSSGMSHAVWVDMGKSDKPAAVQVDTKAPPKQN